MLERYAREPGGGLTTCLIEWAGSSCRAKFPQPREEFGKVLTLPARKKKKKPSALLFSHSSQVLQADLSTLSLAYRENVNPSCSLGTV